MTVLEACPNLSPEAAETCERYLDLLQDANARVNLTAIRDRSEMAQLHIADSLSAVPFLSKSARVLDIGCGAGLPSIVLKIARPDLEFLLVDSVGKKTDFVNAAIRALNLTGIRAVHSRIEEIPEHGFDYVVARAVAPLGILCEYALPCLAVHGTLIAYKGDRAEDEIEQTQNALHTLGGRVSRIAEVPQNGLRHTLVLIEKLRPTPGGYPRERNLPRLKPL